MGEQVKVLKQHAYIVTNDSGTFFISPQFFTEYGNRSFLMFFQMIDAADKG